VHHCGGWTQIFGSKAPEMRVLNRSKNAIFTYPTCTWHPRCGWCHQNFCSDRLHHKIRIRGLSHGIVFEILHLAVVLEHRFVTDRRTDMRCQQEPC